VRVRSRAIVVAIVAVVVVVLAAGVTDAFGTGTQLQVNLPASFRDGAAADTFWDSQLLDVPGVSLAAVHCHGNVTYEFQLGATGPSHDNSCYAAMGLYSGSGTQWGVYLTLPGDRAVYRISDDYHPWRYCIAGLIFEGSEPATEPPKLPC
jgi:hypothetical protein